MCCTHATSVVGWRRYSDELFEKPQGGDRALALSAMACYLEAVNTNAEGARLMLSRVLQVRVAQRL
jgi:hypothetical protein